ncbi:MAG: hypothetical protein KF908_13770 [Nitrosomonas sp.]|nr:hypothetical protein [Nitrosomonas sp.]MCW5607770.1 hypothetical protein [Nitrosomonas sp.]
MTCTTAKTLLFPPGTPTDKNAPSGGTDNPAQKNLQILTTATCSLIHTGMPSLLFLLNKKSF